MIRRIAVIFFSWLIVCTAQAAYTDEQLYEAYLSRHFDVWNDYITTANWDEMSLQERKRLLHYEFGFTARAINDKRHNARELLTQYENHIEALKSDLTQGMYHLYHSAACSYEVNYDKANVVRYATAIYEEADKAMKLEPNNPVIITLRGQLELYNPFGNAKKSIGYFTTADSLYHLPGAHYYKWNIRAEQMAMLNGLVKTNKKDRARQLANDILKHEEPSFEWISKEFLPSIEK